MSSFINGNLARSFMPESLAVASRDLDSVFDHLFGTAASTAENSGHVSRTKLLRSPILVWEQDDKLHVQTDLPGVSKEAINVTIENGVLQIEAERARPDLGESKVIHSSVHFGTYKQRVAVGDQYDSESVDAVYNNGVLTLQIAKKLESQPKKIEIK